MKLSGLCGNGARVAALSVLLIAGCGSFELKSHWHPAPIDIDGRSPDWQNMMTQVEGKQIMVGVANDSNYLYVAFVTDDQSVQRQIMFRGLTVWFDYGGGEDKRFGIKFPTGVQGTDFRRTPEREEGSDESMRERIPLDTNEAEIIGPTENSQHRVRTSELKQIAMKVDFTEGRLTYGIKVPLIDNGPDPYAIGARMGTVVGVGFETGARIERQRSEEPGGGEMPGGDEGGGYGRYGGGRRGGRGGFGGGGRPARSGQQEPLSLWAKVELATPETPTK